MLVVGGDTNNGKTRRRMFQLAFLCAALCILCVIAVMLVIGEDTNNEEGKGK